MQNCPWGSNRLSRKRPDDSGMRGAVRIARGERSASGTGLCGGCGRRLQTASVIAVTSDLKGLQEAEKPRPGAISPTGPLVLPSRWSVTAVTYVVLPRLQKYLNSWQRLMPKNQLSPELTEELKSVATPVAIYKGNVIFRAGQPVRGAFLIRRGQVAMRLNHSSCFPTRTVGSGRIIGLPATFSGEPYSLTAEAKTDCLLYYISRPMMLSLLRHNPKVGYQIVRILSEDIFQMRKSAAANSKPRKASEPSPY